MGRTTAVISFAVAAVLAASVAAPAHAEPSDERLVLTGLAMAPPMYLVGVTMHEGSHAVAAKLMGATIEDIRLFPPGIDPKIDKFRFGWVYVRGLRGRNAKIFMYLAPKITDAIFLSTYAALYFTDALPDNKYGQLALIVGATGFWVDFAKDVVLTSRHNDVVKAFHLWCMRGWKQVAPRVLYAAIDVGFAYVIWRGYQKLFADSTQQSSQPVMTLPLVSATF
jgi:hypothetical protein